MEQNTTEDFDMYLVQVEQLGTGKKATVRVKAPMGTPYEDVVEMVRRGELREEPPNVS